MTLEELQAALATALGTRIAAQIVDRGQLTLEVKAADVVAAATSLRDDPALAFTIMVDLLGIDYQGYAEGWEGKRYAVGEARFGVVVVNETGPDIKLSSLSIPGKVVNPGFVTTFSSMSLLAPYHKLEALAPVMKAIKSVKVTSTGVELSTAPAP